MIDNTQLYDCFSNLVKFRQAYKSGYPSLADDLVTGDDAISLDQVHPLLTVETLSAVAPEGLDSTQFSDYLRRTLQSTSREVAVKLLEHKKLRSATGSIINDMILYNSAGLLSNREIKQGRFVGVKISVLSNGNIASAITQIGLQMSDEVQNLNIHLYHSSSSAPVTTVVANSNGDLGYTFTKVANLAVGYQMNGKIGGEWYLGYFEDDLPTDAQAINRNFDITQRVCMGCNKYNYEAYSAWSKYLSFQYFYVSAANISGTTVDFSGIVNVNDRNYGLNLAITTECNLSPFFCSNKLLFASAYSKLVAVNLLQKIAYSDRINFVNEQVRNTAVSELDPKENSGSMLDKFNQSLAALDYDFSGFDNQCLPCNKKRIRIGVIG